MKVAELIEYLKEMNQEEETAWAIWSRKEAETIAANHEEVITEEEQDMVIANVDQYYNGDSGITWDTLEDAYTYLVSEGLIKPQKMS